MGIFQKSVINKHLTNLDKEQVEKAYQKFKENYSPAKIEKIKQLKEEEYQDGFLRDLFVDVFGYILKPDDNYNLVREFKNQDDGRKVDGAVLKDEKAIAVIELKSTKTKDLKSITEQAFNYKNNQPDCKYVITSNFHKLRFYIDYTNEFEEFDLFHLQKTDFELLYLILNSDSIFSDLPLKLKEETKFHEQDVSDKLYNDYSDFKSRLFDDLVKKNPDYDKLTLFKKSQKLLDRFLFILFAEDSGLLPPNSISRIIKRFNILKDEDSYRLLYDIYKQYFGYMNIGRKGKNRGDDIPAYNGGLFYPDEILDSLKIDDDILIDDLIKLSSYDFNTEVDVNILGHIFEHSLSEIEEITAEIEGTTIDKTKSKRKKDGVFYTPKYITQYIVENTIGILCNQKRKELEIEEIEFDGTYRTKEENLSAKGKKLYQKLKGYKDWLFSLKIVDPACGSGAFLNQALNYLIREHRNIDDIISELTNTALRLFDTDISILENNLYGVDINEESIEIAKLSLWLRTAQKGRKLSVLSNNIKCGNSLIDDPEVAGEKAFDWNKEFPEIMQNGGFDVVIGNPPYVTGALLKEEKEYLKNNFVTAQYQLDLYILFIERTLDIISIKGYASFITPNSWLKNLMMSNCRKLLLDNTSILKIVPNIPAVFEGVNVDSLIFVATRQKIESNEIEIYNSQNVGFEFKHSIRQDDFIKNDKFIFTVEINSDLQITINKLKKDVIEVGEIFDITRGVNPYDIYTGQEKSTIESKAYHADFKKNETFVPELRGKHISRYVYNWDGIHYISYGDWLAAPRNPKYFTGERIIFREILGKNFVCTYIEEDFIIDRSLYIGLHTNKEYDCKYVIALLASKILAFYFRYVNNEFDALFPKIRLAEFKKLPIKKAKQLQQQPFIEKADNMLELNRQLQKKQRKFLNRVKDNFEIEKISKKLAVFYDYDFKIFVAELKKQKIKLSLAQQDEWEEYFTRYKNGINQLQDEINTTDKEIDHMVYELYGLSEEEIKIIENF